jgi:hypothetical protein
LQRNYEQDRANKKPDETIGEIFHKFAPFLKTYTSYTNNFNSIDESLRVIRQKNRELDEFLKSQSRIAGQTLESYLIMPVQRIPRYNLLLKELLKHTSQYHRDYRGLEKALEAMQEVANHVNEKIRELEAVNHMILIKSRMEKQLEKNPLTQRFIIATRLFNSEWNGKNILYIHSRKKNSWIPCSPKEKSSAAPHLLIFNDIMLICRNPSFAERERKKDKKAEDDESLYEQLQLEDAILLAPPSIAKANQADYKPQMKLPWMIELENNIEHKHGFMLVAENDIYTFYFANDDRKYDFMKLIAELLDGALKRDPNLKDHRALFLDYTEMDEKRKKKQISQIGREQLPKFSSKKKQQEFLELVTSEKIEKIKEMDDSLCIGFCTASVTFQDPDTSLFQLSFYEGDVMAVFEKVKKGKKYWLVRKCGFNLSPARKNQLLENKLPETYKEMLTLMRYQQADKNREKWKKPPQLRKVDNHIIKVDKKTDKEMQELAEQLDIKSLLADDGKSLPKISKKDRKSLAAASLNQFEESSSNKEDFLLNFLQKLMNIYAEKGEVGVVPSKYMMELPSSLNEKFFQLLAKREELELKKKRNFMTTSEKRRLTVMATSPGNRRAGDFSELAGKTSPNNSPGEGTETRVRSKSHFARLFN